MPNYLSPGVYVEEVSLGARPIEAVGTSTVGFLGIAPNAAAHLHKAIAINNWAQFTREFVADNSTSTPLSHAVYGFFLNGGSRCYVVNLGDSGSLIGSRGQRQGLDLLEPLDEIAIVAAPGMCDRADQEALLSHCERLKNRFAILDAPEVVSDLNLLTRVGTAPPTRRSATSTEGEPSESTPAGGSTNTGLRPRQSDYAALYFPWLTVEDPLASKTRVDVPPSGHLAGIYARSDAMRGVHKAPANELIRGALGLTYQVTHQEQGDLNQNGVNCIRFFSNEGIRVWGARTLAASSSEYRYINVRRLAIMIEGSIARSTRWIVFEPNDYTLWMAIRRDVGAFLTLLWRQGALMGRSPEEAFFVKCDEETNPPEEIDAGRVITLIGVAPVKPAEFVVFRISQNAGRTETESAPG